MGNQQCSQTDEPKRTRIWYAKQFKHSNNMPESERNIVQEINNQRKNTNFEETNGNIHLIEKLFEQKYKVRFKDGTQYVGDCKQTLPHGDGTQTRLDGSTYVGQYYMGRKNGRGKYTWPDGSYYNGDWRNNQIEGQGIWVQSNGWNYKGKFVNNQMHGFGTFKWESGRFYQGQYVCNYKQGFGIYHWPNGNTFQGFWKRGKRHGKGTMLINGQKRQGIWKNDQRIKWVQENKKVKRYLQEFENSKPIIF